MKKILYLLAICCFGNPIQAQDASEKELKKHAEKVQKSKEKGKNIRSMDTLFASGKPYCIMKGMRRILGGYGEYSVRPIKKPDEEVIYLSMEGVGPAGKQVYFWNMIFPTQGQKIRFQNGTMDLENTIVDFDLLNDSGINIRGVNKLVLLKGGSSSGLPPVVAESPSSGGMVTRDRNGMVQIFGDQIKQGGVHIGNITQQSITENGTVYYRQEITFITGELVATAKNAGITDHEWTVITARDNKEHLVSSSIVKDKEDVVKYLIEHLYL